MARKNTDAQTILGKQFFPGFGPGDSGAATEFLFYNSSFGVLGFAGVNPSGIYLQKYIHTFDEANPRIDTAIVGTGTAVYEPTGGLTLDTGGTSGGAASAFLTQSVIDLNQHSTLHFTWENAAASLEVGDGEMAIGITDSATLPTNLATDNGVWIYIATVSGTTTVYFCTSNGVSVTATDITSALTGSALDFSDFIITMTEDGGGIGSISLYDQSPNIGEAAVATHTTNLPASGIPTASQVWRAWIETGDTNVQAITLDYSEYATK